MAFNLSNQNSKYVNEIDDINNKMEKMLKGDQDEVYSPASSIKKESKYKKNPNFKKPPLPKILKLGINGESEISESKNKSSSSDDHSNKNHIYLEDEKEEEPSMVIIKPQRMHMEASESYDSSKANFNIDRDDAFFYASNTPSKIEKHENNSDKSFGSQNESSEEVKFDAINSGHQTRVLQKSSYREKLKSYLQNLRKSREREGSYEQRLEKPLIHNRFDYGEENVGEEEVSANLNVSLNNQTFNSKGDLSRSYYK